MEEKSRFVQYWAAVAVAISAMTSSVAFSWTTPVIPKFHSNETNLYITDAEISWVVAATSPGVMIGSLVSRVQSDWLGRRATVLASAFPFAIGTIFVLFATKAWMIYIARFLWGIGAGTVQTIGMIYIAEIADKEIRGSLAVINRFLFNFGSFLVVVVGSFVSYQTLSYMLIVLPVVYFISCWFIPETPYFLLKENKVAAARKELMKLNRYKNEYVLEEKLSEMRLHVKEETRRTGSFFELITGIQYRKAVIISVGLKMCQVLSGSIPIIQYLGRILQETKSDISVAVGLIVFSAIRFLTCLFASTFVDKVGRRTILIYSFFGSFLALAIVGSTFYLEEVILVDNQSSVFGYVVFIGLVTYIVLATLGFDTIIFVVPAEIFPLNVKSVAMTSTNLFGAVVTFITVKCYQGLKDWTGLYGVFWFFSTAALIGAVFTYLVVPETKGKGLREIQMELQGDLYEKDIEKLNKVNDNGVHEAIPLKDTKT